MPAKIYDKFSEPSKEGREFIRLWNSAYKDGIQIKIAQHFGVSIPMVYRVRKKLGLADLHDSKNHPGKKQFFKRVKRLYLKKERSTLQIAKIFKMTCENIRKILINQGVELRPQHITNPLYFPTNCQLTPTKLIKEIKHLYIDEKLSASRIAKKLGIDQGTVRTKLKAMNIEVRHMQVYDEKIVVAPNYNIKGIYLGTSEPFSVICFPEHTIITKRSQDKRKTANCQWCANEFRQYIDTGERTQKFCTSRCKNRAKDYRRMMKGLRVSHTRIKSMQSELKTVWGVGYQRAIARIMDVKPIITTSPIL